VDKFGELLGGVIFTLTRTHSYDPVTDTFTDIIDEPTVVQDNLFPDINPVFGQFRVIHLPLGSYTLEETFPIPGYDPDTTVVSFNLTDTDPFFNVEDPFVNTWSKRAFVGSTYAARQAYLESIGLTLNTQELAPVDDAVLIPADAVRYPLANVLVNDFEQHGDDPLTIVDVGIPSMGGTAELIDGMIYYTPSYAFDNRLVESFSYTVSNGTVTETAMITPYSHGAASRLDLNADGFVAPLDALLVIRELNVDGPRPLQEFETPDATAADTNGDRYLSALDALLVLHHMTESPTTFQAIMAPPQTPGGNTAALDYVFRQLDEDDPL
ncbi:MAG: dockerin type I domain-containing protein, partial [Planctomycetota bacterium]